MLSVRRSPCGSAGSPTLEERFTGKEVSGNFDPSPPTFLTWRVWTAVIRTSLLGLADHLHKNGFEWEQRVRYIQRIYFEADGKAAYYLHEFRNAAPKGSERRQFEELVVEYLSRNELDIEGKEPFAFCPPVILRPKEERPPFLATDRNLLDRLLSFITLEAEQIKAFGELVQVDQPPAIPGKFERFQAPSTKP